MWRETMGEAIRPLLGSRTLDRVKYAAPARRLARDRAAAPGFSGAGVLAGTAELDGTSRRRAVASPDDAAAREGPAVEPGGARPRPLFAEGHRTDGAEAESLRGGGEVAGVVFRKGRQP